MTSGDTIAAISSSAGAAARMIVRISGGATRELTRKIVRSNYFAPRELLETPLHFSDLAVDAQVYCFAAPHSATGEDSAEFHIPGNPVLARLLLDALIHAGARQAEAGEFSARAHANGKLSLAAAEGVALAIAAHSERELRAARQLMSGELARRLAPPIESIAQLLGLVEVGIDFADEDVTFISSEQLQESVHVARKRLEQLLARAAPLERLSHEPVVVLVGEPNAGKSTLLNALAQAQRAVVSPVAGTTRDALSADVRLARGMVRVIDVAGFEPAHADDPISRGMALGARRAMESADVIVVLRDAAHPGALLSLPAVPTFYVATKADLGGAAREGELLISALTGAGLDELRAALDQLAFASTSGEGVALNARHTRAILAAVEALARAVAPDTCGSAELVALELREALDHLGSVVGAISTDDVLGKIFATFCIGK